MAYPTLMLTKVAYGAQKPPVYKHYALLTG